jgi:hypothetical protein
MTEMRIVDLCTCRGTDQPMVLLEDEQRTRWLSFYLPMNEANRLARVLGKTPCRAVPIFELLGQVAQSVDLSVLRAEIDGDDRGVSASIVFRQGALDLSLACHPADAMALALRAGAPIFASDSALARGCAADPELRAQAVQRWLDRLTPSDFVDDQAP